MEPRISVITLAVENLEKSLEFYRDGLGWPTQGIIGTEFAGDEISPAGAAAMFELQNGLIFMLYPKTELAKDSKQEMEPANSTEFSIGYLVKDKDDVDALLNQAQAAGAVATDVPHDRPWGIYSGYFKDLDGHLWEIIWNPQMLPE